MHAYMNLLNIWLVFAGIKLVIWIFRKIYNPALTQAGLNEYVPNYLKGKNFSELKVDEELLIPFADVTLYARYSCFEVEGIPGAILSRFRVSPNSSKFGIASDIYFLFRDPAHLKWIQNAMADLASASQGWPRRLKGQNLLPSKRRRLHVSCISLVRLRPLRKNR
jgi:hypothetical protein